MLNARGEGEGKGEEEEEEGRGREGEEEEQEAEADVKYLCSYFGYFILGGSRRIPRPPLCMKPWVDLKVKVTQQRWANGRHIATSWDRQNMYGDRALGL